MMKAEIIAEKRPILKPVSEVNRRISRLGLTNTRTPFEPSFQASAIRLSSFLTSSRYIFHNSFPECCTVNNVKQSAPFLTHHHRCVCPLGWVFAGWSPSVSYGDVEQSGVGTLLTLTRTLDSILTVTAWFPQGWVLFRRRLIFSDLLPRTFRPGHVD